MSAVVSPLVSPSTQAVDTHHLLLPYAAASDPACQALLPQLNLPHLQQLLARLHPQALQAGDDFSLTPPHEHALAHALGWADRPDGALPWAAWHAGISGTACAWFTPCHWNVGMEQVTVLPPDSLALSEAHSRALLQALAPFAQEDGLTLVYEHPGRWRAEGTPLADLRCASLDRVAHRRADAWLLDGQQSPAARLLLRLQNEAQMLFYTHAVNDERAAQGLPPVNGFWISGAGVWNGQADTAPAQDDTLRQAALRGDWAAWRDAWQALDGTLLRDWVQGAEQGKTLQITLCGERGWQSWSSAPSVPVAKPPFWQRWFRRTPAVTVATTLSAL